MSKLCKDCVCENVCGITHLPEDKACVYYKAEAVTELESVKAEIIKKHKIDCSLNCNKCIYYPCLEYSTNKRIKDDLKIIDKHIAELKGENNE